MVAIETVLRYLWRLDFSRHRMDRIAVPSLPFVFRLPLATLESSQIHRSRDTPFTDNVSDASATDRR